MAFLLPVLEGLGSGILGNALGGVVGGAAGSAENGAMNALNSQDESFQLGMYESEVQNQEHVWDIRTYVFTGNKFSRKTPRALRGHRE